MARRTHTYAIRLAVEGGGQVRAELEKSLRTLRYELDLTEATIAKLQGRIDELRESPTLGFTTFIDTAQISAFQQDPRAVARVPRSPPT